MSMYNSTGRSDQKYFKNTAAHGRAINLFNRIWRGGIRF